MSIKVEGTIVFEGLIEGPLPPFPDARQKLDRWSQGVAGGLLRFDVQIDGGHFNLLPSNEPLHVKSMAASGTADPSVIIADALYDLLRIFPPPERGKVFSTLRSVEYRHDLEVQTLYAVGPDGRAATRQATAPAQTVAADAPVSRREMLKRGGLGLGIALLLLLASSTVVDYPGLWRKLTARVEPVKVAVDPGTFAPYFQMEVTGIDRGTGNLQITLTRSGVYPQNDAALDALYANPPADPPATAASTVPATAPAGATEAPGLVRRRLAIESLARGVVRLEFRDENGQRIGESELHIGGLSAHSPLAIQIPGPDPGKPVLPASIKILPE